MIKPEIPPRAGVSGYRVTPWCHSPLPSTLTLPWDVRQPELSHRSSNSSPSSRQCDVRPAVIDKPTCMEAALPRKCDEQQSQRSSFNNDVETPSYVFSEPTTGVQLSPMLQREMDTIKTMCDAGLVRSAIKPAPPSLTRSSLLPAPDAQGKRQRNLDSPDSHRWQRPPTLPR